MIIAQLLPDAAVKVVYPSMKVKGKVRPRTGQKGPYRE
jgi:hypothetical protein